jgi:hypothetical protein
MRVLGKSTIEPHGRLLHVGYLAASTPNPAVGLPSMLVILLGLFAFSMAFVRRTRWRRGLAVAGCGLVLGGVGGSWWAHEHQVYPHPEHITADRIIMLQRWMDVKPARDCEPDDIRAAVRRFGLDSSFAYDGWGRRMHVDGAGAAHRSIRSAGPDGVFGNDDDVTADKALGSKWGRGMPPDVSGPAPADNSAPAATSDR